MRPPRSNRNRRTRRYRTRRGGDLNNGANAALHVNPNPPMNPNDPPPYVPQLVRRNAIYPALPPANVIHPIEPAGPIHFPPFAFPPMPPQRVDMDVNGMDVNGMGGKRRVRRTRRHR